MTEVETSPVFVDQTGRRGRRLRGLGWVFGAAFVGMTLAMVSGLLGTQSDAPTFAVPGTADTLPPGQYVNAPLPAPPGKADRNKGVPHTAATTPSSTATPTATATGSADPTATASATASTTRTAEPPAHSTTSPPEHAPPSTPARSTAGATTAPPHPTPTGSATPPPTQSSTTAPPAAP
jgi:hypothetical protein|nr:hypothetical protein OH826_24930 [Streptomyces sp. NBC_00899]